MSRLVQFCSEKPNPSGLRGRGCVEDIFYIVFINSDSRCLCFGDKYPHCSNNAACSLERGTILLLLKNWLNVIPNASQIASNVDMLGIVLRWKIFAMVEVGSFDSFTKRYSLQPRSFVNCLIF